MFLKFIVIIMLTMAPRLQFEDVIRQAEAISFASGNNTETVAILVTVSYYETTFNPGMRFDSHTHRKFRVIPFGLSSVYDRLGGVIMPMEFWATRSAVMFGVARQQCGQQLEYRYGFYYLGYCNSVGYPRHEAITTRRILRRLRLLTTEN